MILLDGNALRDTLLDELATEVASLPEAPRLTVLQVGEDPASGVYIRNKMRACERTGVIGGHLHLPADVTQAELEARMAALSAGAPDGVILQLPLPAHLDENAVMALLDPDKDVDGFHPVNLGRLVAGLPGLLPCTPAGVRELLRRNDIPTRGKHVVVIGRSVIVGKPAALLFLQKHALGDATVTVCHSASAEPRVPMRTGRSSVIGTSLRGGHGRGQSESGPSPQVCENGPGLGLTRGRAPRRSAAQVSYWPWLTST